MLREAAVTLDVVASTLLHLDEAPTPGLGIVDILRNASDANGICHKLDLVLHTRGQLVRLRVAVDVDLLCAAGDDEDG